MSPKKWMMVYINFFGGIAVLGSYAIGLLTHPGSGEVIWGGIPQSIQPFYTAGMFLAAIGYFAFTYFILLRLNPMEASIDNRFGFGLFNALYAGILIPSALWMPLTFLAVEHSSPGLLWIVRIDLAAVGICSLGLLFTLLNVKPRRPKRAYWIAVGGCVFFCLQTVILDAILWGTLFRVSS